MVEFKNQGPKVTADDLTQFEQVVGKPIPADYKHFLLTYNGGIPTKFSVVDIEGMRGSPTDIQVLFGIRRSSESSDLFWNLELYAERLASKQLVPIGCDSGSGRYCLSLAEGSYGSIVFFDWSFENLQGNFYPVAADFTAFLNKAREFE